VAPPYDVGVTNRMRGVRPADDGGLSRRRRGRHRRHAWTGLRPPRSPAGPGPRAYHEWALSLVAVGQDPTGGRPGGKEEPRQGPTETTISAARTIPQGTIRLEVAW